ncbi:hypothetical protein, variant [Cryptococcus amylolentus CBS 6039]|uniref:Uncharacterized protein n=1 Tax=Cryptococcus amylolentus CBS 6039 TaxID=1295533 RepID=A0A1E3HA24_9TREE|nr:hypothetical protein, variant [Cryptococcus amylolentus CBS 6039]ODN73202.1 hypothetical protein, variant [Cryptococcus amylolentus CBS 6039]
MCSPALSCLNPVSFRLAISLCHTSSHVSPPNALRCCPTLPVVFCTTTRTKQPAISPTRTHFANRFSPALYRHACLNAKNASGFFRGLDGQIKSGEEGTWRNGGLEGKIMVARRLMWLSMVRRLEIQDPIALKMCQRTSDAVSQRDFGSGEDNVRTQKQTFLFFDSPHPSCQDEEAVLLLRKGTFNQHNGPHLSSFLRRGLLSHLAQRHSLHLELPPNQYNAMTTGLFCVFTQLSREHRSSVVLYGCL